MLRSLDGKDVYFIAICGTAMAALAAMLKSLGYRVRGSDQDVYPPMSTFLRERGITVFEGFETSHLEPTPDLVIIGNVMSRGNPEVEATLERKLRYTSLPEALKDFFLRDRYSIVVAGTHGKTTTCSMIAWALERSGWDPSFLIGGVPKNFGQGFKLGKGQHFVIEGDEYDTAFFDKAPKFMHYMPDLAIISNIEFDHADIYGNMDDVKLAFSRFINIIPRNGILFSCSDDAIVSELVSRAFCPVEKFGLDSEADWLATDIRISSEGTEFQVNCRGAREGEFHIPLGGVHNVRNALAAIAACRFLGMNAGEIDAALQSYEGVKKRLELRGVSNGISIYDDFGHHPTAIRETLRGVRATRPSANIWAVYEPRTATTRRKIFQKGFAECFAEADHVVVAPVHRPDKVEDGQLFSVDELVCDLRAAGKDAHSFPGVGAIVSFLAENLQGGDLVVTFSNGDFDGIHGKLKNDLERKCEDGER